MNNTQTFAYPRLRFDGAALIAPALGGAGLALLLMLYHRFGPRVGFDTRWVLAKEGALEDITFIAELVAAVFLAVSARWLFRQGRPLDRWLARVFLVGAASLFLVAMEEIGWGQQLFHFSTPAHWAAINHQQETTLHNLLDHETLTSSARWIAYAFAAAALLASTSLVQSLHPLCLAAAPHPSLAPMAVIIGIAGWVDHPEVVEVFIAGYALIYCYQAFYKARAYARS